MNSKREIFYFRILNSLFASMFLFCPAGAMVQISSSSNIILQRVPAGGIQPQAAIDSKGIIHLIYYKGDSQAGDIYYVRLGTDKQPLAPPIRVNSQPASAVAAGWVRGAQITIGKNDRVHIIWNGSATAEPHAPGNGRPMLYTRLNNKGNGFEAQRNLIQWASGIDGGGAIAADSKGHVYVFWHSPVNGKEDTNGTIFISRSSDEGENFSREEKANPQLTGACSCCSMKALVDGHDKVYVLYRAAQGNLNRNTILLKSDNYGNSFSSSVLDRWKLDACPLTTYSITQFRGSGPVLGSWIGRDQVYFARFDLKTTVLKDLSFQPVFPEGTDISRKYQTIAINARREKLLAWVEGMSWGKGGILVWQIFDENNQPIGERQHENDVVPWNMPVAITNSDGGFLLIY